MPFTAEDKQRLLRVEETLEHRLDRVEKALEKLLSMQVGQERNHSLTGQIQEVIETNHRDSGGGAPGQTSSQTTRYQGSPR